MSEYQFSYNGLTFGEGTDIDVEFVDGLDTMELDVTTPNLPRYHGGLIGESWLAPREITMRLWLNAANSEALEVLRRQVYAALQPLVMEERPLIFHFPGASEERINCRVVNRVSTRVQENEFGAQVSVMVRWLASDPVIYGNELFTVTLVPFQVTGGAVYSVTYNKVYGDEGAGAPTSIFNEGAWVAWPKITINGPSTGVLENPIIENLNNGGRLAFTANGGLEIGTGQVFNIDSHPARRYARFSTGASRYGRLSLDSRFWTLDPGENFLRFRASGSITDAVATVEGRSARI